MGDWLARASDFGGQLALPSFERPEWLLLIPVLCVLSWWWARGSLAGAGMSRQVVHLILRFIVIVLMCAALAEPSVRWRATDVAVVAVVDVSESVPIEQRRVADAFLAASVANKRSGDRFGLVTVAREAYVQSVPSAQNPGLGIGTTGARDASSLAEGVEFARSLLPSKVGGRLLLISDANETSGSLAAAAETLRSAGIPIDVAAVEYDRSTGVRVEEVGAPAWVRDGDTIAVRVVMSAGREVNGRLTLTLGGEPIDLDPDSIGVSAPLHLTRGSQVFTQQIRLPSGPVQRIEAVFEPEEGDREEGGAALTRLLRAETVTFTSDRGRVLVLTEDMAASGPLVEALSAQNFKIDVRAASGAPVDFAEWTGYDAVVLADEPASNLTQAQQKDIARAVHDAGIGLLVVGGPNSFGAGGWIGSPLADALPVVLDPPVKRQMPLGALALVIDRSGSMGQPVAGTGLTQQQIANEGAILAVRALSRLDHVAVVAFSGDYEVVVPLTSCANADEIVRKIRSIGTGGGTNLFPAIDAAAGELAKSPAGVKHIVILSDGVTTGDSKEGLAKAQELKAKGISVSTIAIGDQPNDNLLKWIAHTGGGRYYGVRAEDSKAKLAQVFIKEAQTVRRTLIWEGPAFSPSRSGSGGGGGGAMRGFEGTLPAIRGYVVTADRGGLSTIELRGQEGDPILAQWQHGLGRVTAYTSDAAARWNAPWVAWDAYEPFWGQQIKWVMRPGGDPNARVTVVSPDSDRARVTLDLLDEDGERLNFATVKGTISPPDSTRDARNVPFRQVGPGRYEAMVDASEAGSHVVSLRYDTPTRSGSVRTAIVRRAAEEVRSPRPNENLLWGLAKTTGGRIYRLDPSGADLWVREHLKMPETARPVWLIVTMAAIGLFLVDVAARRIAVDPAQVKARMFGLLSRETVGAGAAMASLAAAKARAIVPEARGQQGEPDEGTGSGARASNEQAAFEPVQPVAAPPAPAAQPARPVAQAKAAPENPDDVIARLRAAKRRSLPRDGGDGGGGGDGGDGERQG